MRRPIILAAVTALAVRALIVAKLPAPAAWQGEAFARLAQHLAAGHGFVRPGTGPPFEPTAFYPVGYPALLAALGSLTGSVLQAAWVLNIAAATVTAACCAALGYRIAGGRGGYVAGLAYALAPGPALWTAAVMPEIVLGALLVGASTLALSPALSARGQARLAGTAGVLVGAAALVRPHMLLAAPFVGAVAAQVRGTRLLAGAACTLAALAVVLPWTARNCAQVGGCALVSTDDGARLVAGMQAEPAPPDAHAQAARRCGARPTEVARDRCLTRLAARRASRHPVGWVKAGSLRLFRAFAWEWAPVNYLRASIHGAFAGASAARASLICSAWWWAVALAAVVGGRRAARARGRAGAFARVAALFAALFAVLNAVLLAADSDQLVLLALLAPLTAGVFLRARPGAEAELVWAG